MNVCIPVLADRGLESRISPHFGSAPFFLVVDPQTGGCRALANGNREHQHGHCSPLAALQGEQLDAIVVGGIGMGALRNLQAAGIRVLAAEHKTVAETVTAFKAGTLQPVDPAAACAGHGSAHGRDPHS